VDHVPDGVLVRGDQPVIAGTGVPDADARIIVARRTRIDPPSPARTICCNWRPSSWDSCLALTGSDITPSLWISPDRE
jgi:hypothetical protein